jgi:uncharacterized membrane protein
MELWIPGLAVFLLAALIVFLVLPRLGAPVLAALSVVLLIIGVYNHYRLFSSEYRYSTWQDRLKFYAPFVMIASLITAVLFYMGYLFSTKGPSALPASNLPVSGPEVTNALNTVVNTATNAVNNTINTVANAVGLGGNNRGNNKGVLANLGNILTTPNNRRF